MNQSISVVLIIFILLISAPHSHATTQIQAPILKWQKGGCYTSWCETGWYSSPAVADINQDGKMEVIAAAYTLFVLKGEDGSLIWNADPDGERVWPGIIVSDIDKDGDIEIIIANGSGNIHVFEPSGTIKWSRQPSTNELRGLSASDIDNDGMMELVVNAAVGSKVNTWIYEHDGTLRTGWPQLANDTGYAYGVFNDNTAIADINGDQTPEIIVPSDVHYICAYKPDGTQVTANSMYGSKAWGKVGVWESLTTELKGWGECSGIRAERYRTNFAHGAAVITDVNHDGLNEVIVTGNVYDCEIGHPPGKYNGIYIFNGDRSRFNKNGYDWQTVPIDTGAPLSEDYDVIENNQPNPVVADLDGDGYKEILFSSYDGHVHSYWLDKTQHGNWPYSVYLSAEGIYRFASEPVVADLDNDGFAEVLFTSWTQKNSNKTGKLHILNHLGVKLQEISLPAPPDGNTWNGALPAPTLANIDSDADIEIIINTAHSGIMVYDLPGTSNARILWGTGRGNYLRNGSPAGVFTVTPDINKDTHCDVLWRNKTTGQNKVWYMINTYKKGEATLNSVADSSWDIYGSADFNKDGYDDLLWRHQTNGKNTIWYMKNTTCIGYGALPIVSDLNWKIGGIADFNRDGNPDILWRHQANGKNIIWYMNGITRTSTASLPINTDINWEIKATSDLNGDSKPDILWRHKTSGANTIWHMNNTGQIDNTPLSTVTDTAWDIAGTADFNEDGNIDILWRHSENGKNVIWYMKDSLRLGTGSLPLLNDPNWTIGN